MKKRKCTVVAAIIMLFCVLTVPAFAAGQTNGGFVELYGASEVTPYKTVLVDNGLGEWRYGTGIGWEGGLVKTVYSDLDHGSKVHKSSCEIDGRKSKSGWVPARTTSRSKSWGDLRSTAYANWGVK
ncbi:lactococcin 972 family bacteriocin [Muricomes intestini]|uniref:lactococcin 972 family bacteriocin n=1 Tax=Muricomes intestini TaxID=1796634 RepID=UPI002FE2B7DF